MQLSKFNHFIQKAKHFLKNKFGGSFGAMVWIVVTLLWLAGYAVLMQYYHHHWKRLLTFKSADAAPSTFISVVVAARNEATTLPHLLQALTQQTYPQHLVEIILVDDFSTDGTADVAKGFSKVLSVIQPSGPAHESSKKKAIAAGVAAAKGALVVITDADCLPPPQWLQTVALFYEKNGSAFIAAPVKFTHNGSLMQTFQAVDFLVLQGITGASVSAGLHSMCNGANLAYTKQAFIDVKGFENIDHIASGDDMLLMHKIKKKHPCKVHYLKSEAAIVSTPPMPTLKTFLAQRRRWASKTAHYDDKSIIGVLLFVYGLNCWFLVLLVATFFNVFLVYVLIGFWMVKTIVEWPFVQSVARFYKEEKLLPYFPLLQPLHMLYTVSVGFISQWGRYEWKGRKLK